MEWTLRATLPTLIGPYYCSYQGRESDLFKAIGVAGTHEASAPFEMVRIYYNVQSA